MNTKFTFLLFAVSVIVVGISSSVIFFPTVQYFTESWIFIPSFIFWLIGISFMGVSIAFSIIRNYHFFKRELYQKPLNSFKKTIERNSKWTSDALGFISLGIIFNFFLLALFILSPLVSILEELPYVHLMNLPIKPDDKLFNNSLTSTDMIVILIIIFTGPMFLFVLRQLHYKLTMCENMKRYPGSRVLLTFFYAVPIVIGGNMVSQYLKTGTYGISSSSVVDLYQLAMDMVVISSLIVMITIWIIDRKLFAK